MIQIVDTNIFLRFLLNDDPQLFSEAKKIFDSAESGKTKIYFDELTTAEIIWVLLSHYHYFKEEICPKLIRLLSHAWIINPRKTILLDAITLFSKQNFSFVDCWLYSLSQAKNIDLTTFDQKLAKLKP